MVNFSFPINLFFDASSPTNNGGAVTGEKKAAPAVKRHSTVFNLTKIALFLFLFATLVHPASCIENITGTVMLEQGALIGVVIMLTIIVIGIAYMAGSATGNPRFTVFAKDELYHLLFSVLLLVGFSGMLGFSCMTMDFFYTSVFEQLGDLQCYDQGDPISKTSRCYINLAKSDAEQMAQQYLRKYIDNQMAATFSVTIQIPFIDAYTMSAESYKKVHAQQYDLVLNSFIIPALLSLNMQKMLLDFVTDNVITWILPIAFLFRVFIPTRQMGNYLIALSVGLYVIIPFMYTFNLAMYDVVSFDCVDFKSVSDDFVFGSGCSAYGFWNVGRLMPQAFFLPNLTIALFITFMAAINKALRVIG